MRFLYIYEPAKAEGAPPTPEMMETIAASSTNSRKIAQPTLAAK
jgi:hypothetical protein